MIALGDLATVQSPRRARILLAEKCVARQAVENDLGSGEPLGDTDRRVSPQCTAPALRNGDERRHSAGTRRSRLSTFLSATQPEHPSSMLADKKYTTGA
jgi:hypothetical protein